MFYFFLLVLTHLILYVAGWNALFQTAFDDKNIVWYVLQNFVSFYKASAFSQISQSRINEITKSRE